MTGLSESSVGKGDSSHATWAPVEAERQVALGSLREANVSLLNSSYVNQIPSWRQVPICSCDPELRVS
jgi:hypothetical protein